MVEMSVISNPVGVLTNTVQTQAHNQALLSIQFIPPPQTPLPSANDVSALTANIYTSSILTVLQSPVWLPAVVLAPQLALFAGSDLYALRPNTAWTQFITALQPPAWIPSVLIPQPSLTAFLSIVPIIQQMNTSAVALLTEVLPQEFIWIDVAIEYAMLLWHILRRIGQRFVINITDNLSSITDSLVKKALKVISDSDGSITDSVVKKAIKHITDTDGSISDSVKKKAIKAISDALGSITDSLQKIASLHRLITDNLGAILDSLRKKKTVSIQDQISTITPPPTCPPGQLYDPVQGKCVVCNQGVVTTTIGRIVRELGGKRRVALHRNPDRP